MPRASRNPVAALIDGERSKMVPAADAVRLIRPGDTVPTATSRWSARR
jgi:hypothetical protein